MRAQLQFAPGKVKSMLNKNAVGSALTVILTAASLGLGSNGLARTTKIMAQSALEQVKAAHPEIASLEIAALRTPDGCKTIAATEAKEVGEKCDEDELAAQRTNQPYVEEEKDEFDVTLPIHDSAGKLIATAGMDFSSKPGRTKDTVMRDAQKIGAELEKKFPSESDLFKDAK